MWNVAIYRASHNAVACIYAKQLPSHESLKLWLYGTKTLIHSYTPTDTISNTTDKGFSNLWMSCQFMDPFNYFTVLTPQRIHVKKERHQEKAQFLPWYPAHVDAVRARYMANKGTNNRLWDETATHIMEPPPDRLNRVPDHGTANDEDATGGVVTCLCLLSIQRASR